MIFPVMQIIGSITEANCINCGINRRDNKENNKDSTFLTIKKEDDRKINQGPENSNKWIENIKKQI